MPQLGFSSAGRAGGGNCPPVNVVVNVIQDTEGNIINGDTIVNQLSVTNVNEILTKLTEANGHDDARQNKGIVGGQTPLQHFRHAAGGDEAVEGMISAAITP